MLVSGRVYTSFLGVLVMSGSVICVPLRCFSNLNALFGSSAWRNWTSMVHGPWWIIFCFLYLLKQLLFVLKLYINIHKSTFNWMYSWNLKLKEKKQQVHFFKAFPCVLELCSIHIHETCLSFAAYRQPRLSINSSRRCSRDENARERSWQFWPWTVLLFCYRMSYWNFGSVVRTYLRIY